MASETNELMSEEQVLLDINVTDQKDALYKIASVAKSLGFINKEKKLVKAFLVREKQSTTGFGEGFAIPHARIKDILKPGVFFMRLNQGIEWKALDEQPVQILIALIVPESKAADIHMDLITKVSRKIIHSEVQEILKSTSDKQEIITTLINKNADES